MRVAVAGFGIGGAALSIALARDGHEVTVYERAADPRPVGAGFLLQPSGQDVLARLGLLEEVTVGGWPIRCFHAEFAPGRTLSELRYDRRDPTVHALGVARGLHAAESGAQPVLPVEPSRWLGPARDIGLPILTRLPPTRAIMERVLAGRG